MVPVFFGGIHSGAFLVSNFMCEYVLHVICKFSSKPIEFNSVEVGGHLCRYAGGLLLAYMVFVPLCEAGSIDGPSLQAS